MNYVGANHAFLKLIETQEEDRVGFKDDENLEENTTDDQKKPNETRIQCNCKLNKGNPCYTYFPIEQLQSACLQFRTMTRQQKDIAILAKLSCGMHLSPMTEKSKRKTQTERVKQRTDFYYHGQRICSVMFRIIHSVSNNKLAALLKHYKVAGVTPRVHKGKKNTEKQHSTTRKSFKKQKTK